jgi:hypothetical protein
MSRFITRRWWLVSLLGLLAIGDLPSPGQAPQSIPAPAMSVFDSRLEPIRRAASSWEARQGPDRAVVDIVCLVPDLPTFLEAVASWDQGHYFPVLFDDVESTFRFIRAFRPARIVRMPKAAAPLKPAQVWDRAVAAVGDSWRSESDSASPRLRGDQVPKSLGPTPQGVVLSSPSAPMLAGAVALAAGRFQPLLRLDSDKHFAETISLKEADTCARSVARTVGERVPKFEELGDDCDFLTMALDYPYRYNDEKGEQEALDDRIGRPIGEERRWAFAGRLLGNATESAYRAMCSLFLQPDSAVMFNSYSEGPSPWNFYSMRTAAVQLSAALPTSHVAGDTEASLDGWHETFDPSNRFGLVLVNTLGGSGMFNVKGGRHAFAQDIPRGVPTAVLMIHSYSAADPLDVSTIAGRWLANGAFLFFGSTNEPFLDAFRTPRVVSEFIVQRVPLVVAVREMPGESRGLPWRLAFLGDPLYRIKPKRLARNSPRLDRWEPTDRWAAYSEGPRPAPGADVDLFFWSLKAALARLQGTAQGPISMPSDVLVETLLSVRRGNLPKAFRTLYDSLLIEVLLDARKRTALKARLYEVPEAERSQSTRLTIEAIESSDFNFGLAQKDLSKAHAAWLELIKSSTPGEFKGQCTIRLASLHTTTAQREDWRTVLKGALRDNARGTDTGVIRAELDRVEEALKEKR